MLYDGSPGHPDLDTLWALAETAGVTHLGASAAFLMACRKAGLRPGDRHDLARLRVVGSTGSPLPADGARWVYEAVGRDVRLDSLSGGTDVVSAFVGGSPLLPVHAGELSCRYLGARVEAFGEDGRPVPAGHTGELVDHRTAAVHARRVLGRPGRRAAARELLRALPGRVAARRLDPLHGVGRRGHRGSLGLDPQPRRRALRDERAVRRGGRPARDRRQPGHRHRGRRRLVLDAPVRGPARGVAAGRRPAGPDRGQPSARRCHPGTCPTRSSRCRPCPGP